MLDFVIWIALDGLQEADYRLFSEVKDGSATSISSPANELTRVASRPEPKLRPLLLLYNMTRGPSLLSPDGFLFRRGITASLQVVNFR